MANLIQIKRSITNANPVGLANGELAFTANGNVLFIGSPNGSTIAIGGLRTPGVLTANQALVANTTGYLDKILVANLAPTQIWANGSFGTSGQLLTSNGSSLYWQTLAPSVVGSNTQLQFNDGGALGADAGLTYDKDTDTLSVTSVIQTGTINAASHTVGSGFTANSSGVFTNGTVNSQSFSIDGLFVANSTGVFTTGTVNAAVLSVGTSFSANATTVDIGMSTGIRASGGIGTNGQVLTSNGTTVLWTTPANGTVTSIASGNGLAGGPITSTGTLSVQAGDGIVSNSAGVYVLAGTGVTVNATGVHIGQPVATTSNVTFADLTVNGNTKLGDAATDVITYVGKVNTHILPSSNVTYNLGNANERWGYLYAGNVHSTFGYITGNLEVGGDLIVTGNLVTVNTSSLIVQDPLIYLAGNNYASDLVDIGFVGNYFDGSTQRHAGVIRHADNEEFYIFDNYALEPNTNVIDILDPSFRLASLNTYLKSGALQSNSTTVSVTANSTVSVSLTANTLSLSTALAGNSGGTGINSVTNNAILVGNASNGYTQLTLGASGYVLQSNGTALVYDILDGGSF